MAGPERRQGLTHSFDMLGEAARTHADAARYAEGPHSALDRIAKDAKAGFRSSPGISVKLSALHPRYEWSHIDEAKAAMLPVLRELALKASKADVHFTIDAEEADRLEPSLDIIEALAADDEPFADGWGGFGLAVQAYQKRAVPLCDWIAGLARRHGRRFMVRLVKGAYWDTEIKAAQVAGLTDYPVFTRKVATDVSYIACASGCWPPPTRFTRRSRRTTPIPSAPSRPSPVMPSSSSSACMAWARVCTRNWPSSSGASARRRRRCGSTRRSAATRTCSPIWSDGSSKTAPTAASSTVSPTRRFLWSNWFATRSPTCWRSTPSAIPPFRCPTTFSGRAGSTVLVSISATRSFVSRCSSVCRLLSSRPGQLRRWEQGQGQGGYRAV